MQEVFGWVQSHLLVCLLGFSCGVLPKQLLSKPMWCSFSLWFACDTAPGHVSYCLLRAEIWTWCKIRFNCILLWIEIKLSHHHLLRSLSFLHCVFLAVLSNTNCPLINGSISGSTILFPAWMYQGHLFWLNHLWVCVCFFAFRQCPFVSHGLTWNLLYSLNWPWT